ncbi:MAG: histone deacetylase [Gemmatimonadota bacterium]
MADVGLFHHEACSRHDTGWGHPEHQGRLRAVVQKMARSLPDLHGRVEPVEGAPAGTELLGRVHDEAHITRVRSAVEHAAETDEIVRLEADTVVSSGSWDAALAGVGCIVDAVRAVMAYRYRSAFCAVRPPGHHATPDRAMGFCLFNGVAIGARSAIEEGLAERVLIVDWDIHHGNGTQDAFYEDEAVYYLSMHASPHYPGTGAASERGRGSGEGTTLNLPLPMGLEPEQYVETLVGGLEEAACFEPQLVLISAGFDAALGDPLGGFTLEADHFRRLTLAVGSLTSGSAHGRIVSVLEGGYDPPSLGLNVDAHLRALVEAAGTAPPRDAPGHSIHPDLSEEAGQ